jgi:hypothetical protein
VRTPQAGWIFESFEPSSFRGFQCILLRRILSGAWPATRDPAAWRGKGKKTQKKGGGAGWRRLPDMLRLKIPFDTMLGLISKIILDTYTSFI